MMFKQEAGRRCAASRLGGRSVRFADPRLEAPGFLAC